jgi:hypothetical protein
MVGFRQRSFRAEIAPAIEAPIRRSQESAVRCDFDPQRYGPIATSTSPMSYPGEWIRDVLERRVDMSKHVYMVIFFLLMITSIVSLDVLFLRKHFVARLIVNIVIVVLFSGFYFVFLKDL